MSIKGGQKVAWYVTGPVPRKKWLYFGYDTDMTIFKNFMHPFIMSLSCKKNQLRRKQRNRITSCPHL